MESEKTKHLEHAIEKQTSLRKGDRTCYLKDVKVKPRIKYSDANEKLLSQPL
jgi:hypothetical protein